MHLSGLFLYPVKSLRGFSVATADLDSLGLVGDRRFLLVDEQGKFLTQRTLPRMALIETALTARDLVLRAPHGGSCSVPLRAAAPAPLVEVCIWKSTDLLAEDCGVEIAVWLSDFLRTPCRLVRIGEKFSRPVLKPAARPGDLFTFADAAPLLVISEASLTHLNDRILENHGEPVPMDRFRPNLVVTGCPAFAEDTWSRFRLGSVIFRSAGQSTRCPITTTDQLTGERGKEPLRTLATYRRSAADPTDVIFGQNLIHETKSGTLRLGDSVELI